MDELDQGATAEIITPEVEVEDKPKSMDDTIRETLRSLQDKGAIVPDEDKAPIEKNDSIKDAPIVGKTPSESSAVIETKAPNTWKKEAQEAFIKADPVIRAEVERRESDFHKGIEQYKQAATFAQNIDQAISPYKSTLQTLGISPEKAISELMAADHRLRYGSPQEKVAYLAQLAHAYGVDTSQAAELQKNTDPRMFALEQENQQYKNHLQNQQLMGQQQQEQALHSEIATFAADPKHSHFDSVRGHMSALLQAGQAKNLADAYEQAIYANPTTRTAVLQQQATEQKVEAAKKAQAARNASSVNIRSRASVPAIQPIGTMDDTIRAAYRRLTGAN